MLSNRFKQIVLLVMVVLTLTTISITSMAMTGGETLEQKNYYYNKGYDTSIPDVSVDEASSWVERKGFEVVGFLQKFIQPFAIIIFIGCAILTLLGAFGNGRLVSRGLLGMLIALVMYVVVLYSPEIMDIFLGWVMT